MPDRITACSRGSKARCRYVWGDCKNTLKKQLSLLAGYDMRTLADLRVVDGSDEEWAEFAHIQPSKKFTNFEEVRHEISRQMERLAGKNLGIVPHPVGLTIYSPRVPDLFLVDLPGMVKVWHAVLGMHDLGRSQPREFCRHHKGISPLTLKDRFKTSGCRISPSRTASSWL